MLGFFKNDNIATLLPLFLVAALMRMGVWLSYVQPMPSYDVQGLLYSDWFVTLGERPILSAFLAMLFVVFQGFWVNRLVQQFRLIRERSSLFALMYVVFASMLPAFLFVSPALVAVTFVCFSLTPIFSLYRSKSSAANIFDAVFWIVLASFFYPLAFWLLPAYLVGMALLHSIRLSDLVVFLAGILVPNFLAWGICFLGDKTDDFWASSTALQPYFPQNLLPDGLGLTAYNIGLVALVFFILWVFLSFNSYFSRKLMQVKKYITFLYWLLFFAILSYFFQEKPLQAHALLFAPIMGILLGHTMQYARNRAVAEIGLALLVALALLMQFFTVLL